MSAKYVWLCERCAAFMLDGELEEFDNLDSSVVLPRCHICDDYADNESRPPDERLRRDQMHFVRYERKFEDLRDTKKPAS